MNIHPTAVIDSSVVLGPEVIVGPYCYIGPESRIGEGTVLDSHVVIRGHTTLGRHCHVVSGAVLGGNPPGIKHKGFTGVAVGDHVAIHECVTIHRGTIEGQVTRVGNHCHLLAYSHVGHDCIVGDYVALSNSVQVGGHVEIGDHSILGGASAVHQWVKIGRLVMLSAGIVTFQDLPPFALAAGNTRAEVHCTNVVGLRRVGMTQPERTLLKKAYKYLLSPKINTQQAIEMIENDLEPHPYLNELLTFLRQSKRGINFRKLRQRSDAINPTEATGELQGL